MRVRNLVKLLSVGAIALVMTGCGGGSSSSGDYTPPAPVDPMTQKIGIVISYHIPPGDCESAAFQDYMADYLAGSGAYNFLYREESIDVVCATYGKTNDFNQAGGCMTIDMALVDPDLIQYKTSCVIGFDVDTNQALHLKDDISLGIETAVHIY